MPMTKLRRWIETPHWRLLAVCTLVLALSACGSDDDNDDNGNPTGPSGGGSSGSGSSGGGSGGGSTGLAVTIDGAAYNPQTVVTVRSNPGGGVLFTVSAVLLSGGTTTSLVFSAPATVGTYPISTAQIFALSNLSIVSQTTSSAYQAFQSAGSGSITVTSINTSTIAGRVDLTLVPISGATSNKRVVGTFNLTFTQ